MRTLIHARYVIAFRDGRHVLLEDGDVVFDGDTIVFVGPSYPGGVDRRIDAPDRLLCPGFISVHAHLASSSLTKSFLEDRGNPFHYMSGLYEALTLTDPTRVRFRYRLDGYDSDWVYAGSSREASYINLPPEHYRFAVEITNGRWLTAAA